MDFYTGLSFKILFLVIWLTLTWIYFITIWSVFGKVVSKTKYPEIPLVFSIVACLVFSFGLCKVWFL